MANVQDASGKPDGRAVESTINLCGG